MAQIVEGCLTSSGALSCSYVMLPSMERGRVTKTASTYENFLQPEKNLLIVTLQALTPLKTEKPRKDTKEMLEVKNQLRKLKSTLDELVIPKVLDLSNRKPGKG